MIIHLGDIISQEAKTNKRFRGYHNRISLSIIILFLFNAVFLDFLVPIDVYALRCIMQSSKFVSIANKHTNDLMLIAQSSPKSRMDNSSLFYYFHPYWLKQPLEHLPCKMLYF